MTGFHTDGSDWEHTHNTKIYGYLAALKLGQIAAYDSSLKPAARRILSILMGYASTNGYAYPSHGAIAKDLGVSRQAVIKQIKTLVAGKYISCERRYQDGRNTSNMYRLNFALAEEYRAVPHSYRAFQGM
jgi:biotin operon repressor